MPSARQNCGERWISRAKRSTPHCRWTERDETEPLIALFRTVLGTQAFDTAWQKGRSMTPEQIVRDTAITPQPVARAA